MSKLYLDLEETVIRSWSDQTLCNIGKLKVFIDSNPDVDREDVRIFSFAIYNDADKKECEKFIVPMLERALNIKITAWPSVKEIAEIDQRHTGCRWMDADMMGGLDICEFIAIRGKPGAFENYIWATGDDRTNYILIDDVVPSRSIIDHRRIIQIDFINVIRDLV